MATRFKDSGENSRKCGFRMGGHLSSVGGYYFQLAITSVNVPTVIVTGSKQHLIAFLGIVKKQHDKLSE